MNIKFRYFHFKFLIINLYKLLGIKIFLKGRYFVGLPKLIIKKILLLGVQIFILHYLYYLEIN